MPISDVFTEPWRRFVPPGADAAMEAHIRDLWMQGYRPTENGWALPASSTLPAAGSVPPGVPPPAPEPTAPAGVDYASLISGDPEYIRRMADLQGQLRGSALGFGDASGLDLDPNTPGVQTDPALIAQAAANPYSILAQLRGMGQQNAAQITNTANAHGVLFSGANAQAQQNEGAAGAQRVYDARQQFQTGVNQLAQQQGQAYWNVYNKLAQNPPGVGAPPAQPTQPAAPPAQQGYAPPTSAGAPGTVNFTGQPNDTRPVVGAGYHAPGGYPPVAKPPQPKRPPAPKRPMPYGARR